MKIKQSASSNLAGSFFAQAGKKVLIMDCDLRETMDKYYVFETDKFPGLSDYLFTNVTSEDVI
ncbi:MAG: hypothetical protein IPM38_08250 [Ignavibacteria bacterium]|nr:hypothetical protein [Ignavibacteria bacterium]